MRGKLKYLVPVRMELSANGDVKPYNTERHNA